MAKAVTTIASGGEFAEIKGNPKDGSVSISKIGLGEGANNGSRPKQEVAQAASRKDEVSRQGDERLSPHTYYVKAALPVLRSFVESVADKEIRRHYNRVLEQLGEAIKGAEIVNDRYAECLADIEKIGGRDLARSVEELYLWQLQRSIELISAFDPKSGTNPEPLQQLAVLVYAEYILNLSRAHALNEADRDLAIVAANRSLKTSLEQLGFTPASVIKLVGHFGQLGNFADFNFAETHKKVTGPIQDYEPPDTQTARTAGGVRLSRESVLEHMKTRSHQIEGAHRLALEAIDSLSSRGELGPSLVDRRRNPEIDVSGNVLSNWEELVRQRIAKEEKLETPRPLQSGDYISGILGSEKEEGGFLGIPGKHRLKHHIKNVEHKAPVKRPGASREKLKSVQAVEIAIVAGVWEGEWRRGSTLKPGESAPKEFFRKVVDVTVWATTLNSADAVENFIDQLESAQAVELDGETVKGVVGNVSDHPDAQAYRIPVLNHKGEPAFLVVDARTYREMLEVAQVSRKSYAELAKIDPRYAPKSREERHKAFRPELKENTPKSDMWVDRERDFIAVEGIQQEILADLDKNDVRERYIGDQIKEAFDRYTRLFNEFQRDFGRESRYRQIAAERLRERGITSRAPDFESFLSKEIQEVAREFLYRCNAFRYVSEKVYYVRQLLSNPDLDSQELEKTRRELLDLLANLDYEYEIKMAALSNDDGQEDFEVKAREAIKPFMRPASAVLEGAVQALEVERIARDFKYLEVGRVYINQASLYARMSERLVLTLPQEGFNESLARDLREAAAFMKEMSMDALLDQYSEGKLKEMINEFLLQYRSTALLASSGLAPARTGFSRVMGRDPTVKEIERWADQQQAVQDKSSEIIDGYEGKFLALYKPLRAFRAISNFVGLRIDERYINGQADLASLSEEDREVYSVLAVATAKGLQARVLCVLGQLDEPPRLYEEDGQAIRLDVNPSSFSKPERAMIITFENTINEYAKIIPGLAERLRTSLA